MVELVYSPANVLAKTLFKVQRFRLDRRGTQYVPTSGGFVLASNHISYIDFVLAGYGANASKRNVRFMTKDVIFRHSLVGPLMRNMKHIPVDRESGAESYAAALAALRAGEGVGVFPEATMSRSMLPKDFKSGAARLAQEAGVPLIPVALWGTQRLASYDKRSNPKARKVPICVFVGPSVDTSGTPDEVTARLKLAIEGLVDEAIAAYPEDGTGQWWQPASRGGTAPTPQEAVVAEAEAKARRLARRAEREAEKAAQAAAGGKPGKRGKRKKKVTA